MKITKDNFVWKTLTKEEAVAIYFTGKIEVFILWDDDSESLIESEHEFRDYYGEEAQYGIEVGQLKLTS